MSTLIAPDPTTATSPVSPAANSSESMLLGDRKISDEDRSEILQSIEKVAALNRIPAAGSLSSFKPLKKGFVFPLLINLIAALAVAAGVVGSNIYFSRKQATISSQAGTFFSAEGLIVAQLRKQSQQKLKAKDEEIASVKTKLARLDAESTTLRANMQSTIQAKEQALKLQMESQLAAEKARLQKLGISQTEVSSRLATFERQKNSEFASQLDQYKKQSEAALQAKEQQIQAQQEQARKALGQANQERQQLLTQAQKQESQLRAQYEAQTKQLKSSNEQLRARSTAAEAKLQALAAQSQSEQLVSDQIVGSYTTILGDIRQARYDQANKDIGSLQALLDSPKINSLPNIARRRPVDLEILGSLRELIKARTQPGQPVVDPAVLQRAKQVSAAEKLVGEAEAADKSGNAAGAKELYTKAIAAVPVVERAFSALMSVFNRNQSGLMAERENTLADLKKESSQKSSEIDQLTKRLSDTQAALAAARSSVAELRKQAADQTARIDALNKELSTSGGATGDLQKQLAEEKQSAAAYQRQLAQQQSAAADLKKQLAEEKQSAAAYQRQLAQQQSAVADLEKQLAEEKQSAAAYQRQLAQQQSAVADLEKQLAGEKQSTTSHQQQLSQQQATAENYRQQLDAANASSAALKQQLTTEQERVDKLQAQLANAQASVGKLQSSSSQFDNAVASVQGSYTSYKSELTSLISSGTPQNIEKAQQLLLQFIDRSGVDTILPGFSTVARDVSSSRVKLAETSGSQTGREGALNDVIRVTNYLSAPGGTAASASTKTQIEQEAARDPLYRKAAEDIQKLAQRSGEVSGQPALSVKYQLIGTISYISQNNITVEKLVSIPVPQGSTVIIQHKNAQGEEVPIAEGKVTGLSSDSVEVSVESVLNAGASPELLDVVYLQPHSGT